MKSLKVNLSGELTEVLPKTSIGADYDSTKNYSVGDYVVYDGALYRCTTAITTAEAWTAAHWTQVALADDVSDLKSELSELDNSIFDTEVVPKAIDISNINGIVSALGMNGTIATSAGNEGINFTTLSNYDSYYIILEQPVEVWFEDSDITSNYLAVLVGRSFTTKIEREGFILLKSSDAVRYRKNDGNLPTADNKLSLSAGDVLGFTMTAGTMSKIHGFAEETKREVSEEFKNEIITNVKPTYSVESGKIVINQRKAHYEVVHCVDASINQNVWRVYRCGLIDADGGIHYLWDGSDADGVLKLVTDGALEADFVGGYHGDEMLTDIKLFVDGNEIDIANTASGEFEKLEIWTSSNVYHADSNDLAFERFKVITFDDNSLNIKNNFIAKNTVSIAIAYLAMLSVERTSINAYYGNNDYKIMGNTETVTATPNLDHATVNTDYGVLNFRYTGDKRMYDGAVNSYTGTGVSNRLKWYFADIHTVSSRPVILNTNDTIRGEYILEIS